MMMIVKRKDGMNASAPKTIRITCRGAGTAALDELVPLQGDLKTLSEKNYEKLKNSILEHGFSFPFFVWKNKGKLFVLDGHQRDKVLPRMREEGYKIPPLPVVYIEAANEKAARKKILVLTSEYGHMTDASLQQFLKESELDLADLTGTVALPEVDIDALVAELDAAADKAPAAEVDRAEELNKKWRVEPGQIWEIPSAAVAGRAHRLMCGDSTDQGAMAELMDGERASMVFTDPPYGVAYKAQSGKFTAIKNDARRMNDLSGFLTSAFQRMTEHARPRAAFYIWHATSTRDDFAYAMKAAGLIERQQLIWIKSSIVLGHSDYQWNHEPCIYAGLGEEAPLYYGNRSQPTVWTVGATAQNGRRALVLGQGMIISNGGDQTLYLAPKAPKNRKLRHIRLPDGQTMEVVTGSVSTSAWEVGRDENAGEALHPTQKPVGLARIAIANSSLPGEIVLDSFAGSGSTMVAAEELGRIGCAMEMEPKYCAVDLERMSKMGLKPRALEGQPKKAAARPKPKRAAAAGG